MQGTPRPAARVLNTKMTNFREHDIYVVPYIGNSSQSSLTCTKGESVSSVPSLTLSEPPTDLMVSSNTIIPCLGWKEGVRIAEIESPLRSLSSFPPFLTDDREKRAPVWIVTHVLLLDWQSLFLKLFNHMDSSAAVYSCPFVVQIWSMR